MKTLSVDCYSLRNLEWVREPFFIMRNGEVKPASNGEIFAEEGIVVPVNGELKTLYPKDGLAFMEGLHIALHGSYFCATKPYEVDKEEPSE